MKLDDVQRVKSRTVRWIGYSVAEQAIYVQFKRNATYRYANQDLAMYQRLASASSKGGFLARVLIQQGKRTSVTIENAP